MCHAEVEVFRLRKPYAILWAELPLLPGVVVRPRIAERGVPCPSLKVMLC
jgi:hypothetical protein